MNKKRPPIRWSYRVVRKYIINGNLEIDNHPILYINYSFIGIQFGTSVPSTTFVPICT